MGLFNVEMVDVEYFLLGLMQFLGFVFVKYGCECFFDVVYENLFEVIVFGLFQLMGDLQFDFWIFYGDEIDLVNN